MTSLNGLPSFLAPCLAFAATSGSSVSVVLMRTLMMLTNQMSRCLVPRQQSRRDSRGLSDTGEHRFPRSQYRAARHLCFDLVCPTWMAMSGSGGKTSKASIQTEKFRVPGPVEALEPGDSRERPAKYARIIKANRKSWSNVYSDDEIRW